MSEIITTEIIVGDDSKRLEIELVDEASVLSFLIDGKEIFRGDFIGNFDEVFARALKIWADFKYDVRERGSK